MVLVVMNETNKLTAHSTAPIGAVAEWRHNNKQQEFDKTLHLTDLTNRIQLVMTPMIFRLTVTLRPRVVVTMSDSSFAGPTMAT